MSKQKAKNVRRSRGGKEDKSCPVCQVIVKRRRNDKCPECGTVLYLAEGGYFTISHPQERIILYNRFRFVAEMEGIDYLDPDLDIKSIMPKSSELSPVFMKNEAWGASKLLELANKDVELALCVIDVCYDVRGYRPTSVKFLVSNPLIKALLNKARKILNQRKIQQAVSEQSTREFKQLREQVGSPFTESGYELEDYPEGDSVESK